MNIYIVTHMYIYHMGRQCFPQELLTVTKATYTTKVHAHYMYIHTCMYTKGTQSIMSMEHIQSYIAPNRLQCYLCTRVFFSLLTTKDCKCSKLPIDGGFLEKTLKGVQNRLLPAHIWNKDDVYVDMWLEMFETTRRWGFLEKTTHRSAKQAPAYPFMK